MHSHRDAWPQVLVQVNIFNCAGIAIGTCSLHTLLHAICHSSREEVAFHDLSYAFSYFSPFNDLSLHDHVDKNNKDSSAEKICTTSRFVFGVESINSLRAEAKDGDYDESSKPFTSYEALVAFIWKHMTPACKMESNSTRPTIVIHILDMRRRVSEPFSRYTIDNILWPVMVIARDKFGNLSREFFLRVKSDPNIIGSTQCMELTQGIHYKKSNSNHNGLDFGFGKPLWVGVTGRDQETLLNELVIMEIDEAIQAWLTMEMQHVVNLERDIEFPRLALPNRSV
ncbi:Vinorine synthase [Glycine max]|nr:Vinorine synthase [Glycine max]